MLYFDMLISLGWFICENTGTSWSPMETFEISIKMARDDDKARWLLWLSTLYYFRRCTFSSSTPAAHAVLRLRYHVIRATSAGCRRQQPAGNGRARQLPHQCTENTIRLLHDDFLQRRIHWRRRYFVIAVIIQNRNIIVRSHKQAAGANRGFHTHSFEPQFDTLRDCRWYRC